MPRLYSPTSRGPPRPAARQPTMARSGRQQGGAYAREWVKVLEDNGPAHD